MYKYHMIDKKLSFVVTSETLRLKHSMGSEIVSHPQDLEIINKRRKNKQMCVYFFTESK